MTCTQCPTSAHTWACLLSVGSQQTAGQAVKAVCAFCVSAKASSTIDWPAQIACSCKAQQRVQPCVCSTRCPRKLNRSVLACTADTDKDMLSGSRCTLQARLQCSRCVCMERQQQRLLLVTCRSCKACCVYRLTICRCLQCTASLRQHTHVTGL